MDFNSAGFPYFDFYSMWKFILHIINEVYTFVQYKPFVFLGIVVAGSILTGFLIPIAKRAWVTSTFF